MQAIQEAIANSEVIDLSPDIIGALKAALIHSRVIVPNLETPFSDFPNRNHSQAFQREQNIQAILTERQQQLDAVSCDVSDMDTIMDRTEDLREQLIKKKNKIKRSMTFHRKFTSPLSSLPVELLSRIFVNCLPAAYDSSVSHELAPLLLTRICRRWKEVAKKESFRYGLWLKRSQRLPLSIRCFANAGTELQSLLRPYNHYTRVTSLHLLFTETDVEPKFLIQGLPGLRELTIDWHGGDYVTAIAEFIPLLPCTLHTLKLQEVVVDPATHFSTSNKVWAHLKNIYITVKQPHHMLDLLPVCPNLTSLEVNVPATGGYWSEVVHPSEPLESVTHTNLQSLFIRSPSWTTSDLLPAVFDALTLPNLRVLEAYHVWFPDKELKTFVARSNCPLKLFGGDAGMSSLR